MEVYRALQASLGYLELGMHTEAWNELEEIPAEERALEPVICMRMQILQALKKWEDGANLGLGALQQYPDSGSLYLMTAYCLRRYKNVAEARALLRRGEHALTQDPFFHFNLACYDCQLGDLDGAKERLTRAIKLDRQYRQKALDDEDLEPLWASLSERLEDSGK